MKQFIFTWRIENISFSWHRCFSGIKSPLFVPDTLPNSVLYLMCYPKKSYPSEHGECIGFYLCRDIGLSLNYFPFNCELSCVSANNLTLTSYSCQSLTLLDAGTPQFLLWHDVFVEKKDFYLPQDILTLRCRIWIHSYGTDIYGQSFGCTRLEVERIMAVEHMISKINNKKTVFIRSNEENQLLFSADVSISKTGLKLKIQPGSTKQIKIATIKFAAIGKNMNPIKFIHSWKDKPNKVLWNSKTRPTTGTKLELTCELFYSTGKITKSIEKFSSCLLNLPEFSLNSVLSCIPSGKLSDFPRIYDNLWDFYVKQIFCDVELKTETASFWVHKTVLCARSPVFLAMFTNDMNESLKKCVKIEDLEDFTLVKLIKFLYTDSFEEIPWDTALELYYSADKYQVASLKSLCGSFFMKNIDDFKVYQLLSLADRHSDGNLKSQVEVYIVKNHDRMFRSLQWKEFSKEQPLWAARIMIREYVSLQENGIISSYPNAIDDIRSLHQNGIFGDIVIRTKTATFFGNKIILCAGSSRLMEEFTNGKATNILKMEDLEDDVVARLLLFLHTDSLGDLNLEIATSLYKAAVLYQIDILKIKCSCFILENLDASNASNLLQLAHKHQDIQLKSLVEDFITHNSL